ncbi:hypothetical protein OBBRIDRAFT_461721 [Obba rivulosa]|uniref:Uncharacterized protein n=1 Tax=Obba rivulosa TaxID=1052685 RepID=A0A8E2B1W9_9APHY|nr:hypothetical protein OBBRIDRAFT_461721 [Obba rivulosa]
MREATDKLMTCHKMSLGHRTTNVQLFSIGPQIRKGRFVIFRVPPGTFILKITLISVFTTLRQIELPIHGASV